MIHKNSALRASLVIGRVAVVLAALAAVPPAHAAEQAAAPALQPAAPSLDQVRSLLKAGDTAAAVAALRSLAKDKNAEAALLLGELHMEGRGVIHNYSLAADWYQRAADAGDAEAQYKLGRLYLEGKGVIVYLGRAQEMFTRAARQGHAGAIAALTRMGVKPPAPAAAEPAMAATAKEAAKGDAKGDAKTAAAKAAMAKIENALAATEARLKRLMDETAGAGPALAVALIGAEPAAADAVEPALAELVGRYVAAVNKRDLAALKALMQPEYAACAKTLDAAAYDAYLADGLGFPIAPGYGVRAGALKKDAPLPLAGLVTYPVRPSHHVLIEPQGGAQGGVKGEPTSAAAGAVELPPLVLQPVASVNGQWSLVFGCPKLAPPPAVPASGGKAKV